METYATENGGSYSNVTLTKLHNIEPTISETAGAEATTGTTPTAAVEGLIVSTSASNKYVIKSVSSTGNVFKIENNAGTLSFLCKAPGKGGCPEKETGQSEGNWGK